jgi:hypothetical protein
MRPDTLSGASFASRAQPGGCIGLRARDRRGRGALPAKAEHAPGWLSVANLFLALMGADPGLMRTIQKRARFYVMTYALKNLYRDIFFLLPFVEVDDVRRLQGFVSCGPGVAVLPRWTSSTAS